MEFKIREDQRSKHIMIDLNDFDEAITFIKKNDCNGLFIRSVLGKEEVVPDFSRLKEIADKLIWLSFSTSQTLKKAENFDDIYSLKKLKYLFFNDKEKFSLDLPKFSNLIQLGMGEYWEGLVNLDKAVSLETLVLSKYPKDDLSMLAGLSKLETLHVNNSKIRSLDGIEKLSKLNWLGLAIDQSLTDIKALFSVKSLRILSIEKCKHLMEAAVFNKTLPLQEFKIDTIDSLSFVQHMPALEKINFGDCKDGDLAPLLKAPKLKQVVFADKKNYSHKKADIEKQLKGR